MSVTILTIDHLKRAVPACAAPEGWLDPLNQTMMLYGISDDVNITVEFLAQAAHESVSFNRLEENLSYSAERLTNVWPARFPTLESAAQYARQPILLAEHVYGGRMGNGPEGSGDGWRFRGGGIFMTTGRDNYRNAGYERNPDALRTERKAAANAAGLYWHIRPRLSVYALAGDTEAITRVINGGVTGLAERLALRDRWRAALAA